MAGIPILGDVATFTAYLADSVDHALGGDSHLAVDLEIQNDPALSAIADAQRDPGTFPTDDTADASDTLGALEGDVAQAEDTTIREQSKQVKAALDATGKGLRWLPWLIGGVVVVAGVAAVGYTWRAVA